MFKTKLQQKHFVPATIELIDINKVITQYKKYIIFSKD